ASAADAAASAARATTIRAARRAMWLGSASAVEDLLPRTGHVPEIRREPALRLLEGNGLAGGVVLDLVEGDAADGDVARERMRKIDAADGRGRRHRERLGQRYGRCILGPEEIEELALLRVVWTGGVAERRANAAEPLRSELVAREPLVRLVPGAAHELVKVLGERLGEAVGEGLDPDRAVVGVFGLGGGGGPVRPAEGGPQRAHGG